VLPVLYLQRFWLTRQRRQRRLAGFDVTAWLVWFLACRDRAFDGSEIILEAVFRKARFWEKYGTANMKDRQQELLNRLLKGSTENSRRRNTRRSKSVRRIRPIAIFSTSSTWEPWRKMMLVGVAPVIL
jgi:Fic family protein